MQTQYKSCLAKANSIGERQYGLKKGKIYKVMKTEYGVNVYDSIGCFIVRTNTNAFDNYKEIKQK